MRANAAALASDEESESIRLNGGERAPQSPPKASSTNGAFTREPARSAAPLPETSRNDAAPRIQRRIG